MADKHLETESRIYTAVVDVSDHTISSIATKNNVTKVPFTPKMCVTLSTMFFGYCNKTCRQQQTSCCGQKFLDLICQSQSFVSGGSVNAASKHIQVKSVINEELIQ